MKLATTCLIGGAGPAGIMLGLLLARAGVPVIVAEKHADFLRDFRGDTVHTSTLQLLDELGLGRAFAAIPHSRLPDYRLPIDDHRTIVLGDFSHLPGRHSYIAMAPQWDLLSMLAHAAEQEPGFRLMMSTEVLAPLIEHGRVVGARIRTPEGDGEIRAALTVACDGRDSVLRGGAGLVPRCYPVPYDVWWFRLSRSEAERNRPATLLPKFSDRDILLTMTREDFHQVAYLAPKGSQDRLRAEGIEAFRARIARLRPDLADRVGELRSMDDLPILRVEMNRLHRWHRPGLLCIGDAAHAMSPSGGVGVNLAIQDAVAAARILAGSLQRGREPTDDELDRVRRRRLFPTVFLQTGQRVLHRMIYVPVLAGRRVGGFQLVVLLLRLVPWLARPVGRVIAIGPRPEHAPGFAVRPER